MQLQRYGVDVLLLEKERVGGLLINANLVENYLGFPGGIPGEQLVELFRRQVQELEVRLALTEVIGLDYLSGCFQAITIHGEYSAPVAVVATGTTPKALPDLAIPGQLQKQVISEIHPVKHVTGKRFVLIGAGDLAFDYALNLSRHNEVIILNRDTEKKCLPVLWERAQAQPGIRYWVETCLQTIAPHSNGQILLSCLRQGGKVEIQCDYLVIAIGRQPQTGYFSPGLRHAAGELQDRGLLHLIGDVKNGLYRQAAIAAGDGIYSAMKIFELLKGSAA